MTKNSFVAEVTLKDFYSKCDQIRRKLRIWSHLLKKSLMENFVFCAVVKKLPYFETSVKICMILSSTIEYVITYGDLIIF